MSYYDNNDKNTNSKKVIRGIVFNIVVMYILAVCLWYGINLFNESNSHKANKNSQVTSDKQKIFLPKDERYKDIEDPVVLNSIGHSYLYNGEYDKALPFIVKSADKGYFRAQNSLGCMYLNGEGLKVDYKMALFWFKESAKQGHPKAIANIGVMYENGAGVEKDYKKALELYKTAAELNYPEAQRLYDRLKSKI